MYPPETISLAPAQWWHTTPQTAARFEEKPARGRGRWWTGFGEAAQAEPAAPTWLSWKSVDINPAKVLGFESFRLGALDLRNPKMQPAVQFYPFLKGVSKTHKLPWQKIQTKSHSTTQHKVGAGALYQDCLSQRYLGPRDGAACHLNDTNDNQTWPDHSKCFCWTYLTF
jgi:hypothetical protein